ncbi:MAG: cell division protein FtsZ, partial [Pseudomonadota bacterium]
DDDAGADEAPAAPSFASLTPGTADEAAPEEDELVLGGEDAQPVYDDDAPEPAAPEAPAPRVASGGGTLFERMSNLTRGGSKAEEENEEEEGEAKDPLDIPRFLNRQNNQ